MPKSVTEGGAILGTSYTYTTDGVKRAVTPAIGTGCAYLGTMVFAKEAFDSGYSLESCGFSGGRFVPDGSSTAVRYYITDHLGSTRCLAEKYYDSTPYNYCAGNPLGVCDPQGDTLVVLFTSGLIGHMALMAQNESGEYALLSKNGDKRQAFFYSEANADDPKRPPYKYALVIPTNISSRGGITCNILGRMCSIYSAYHTGACFSLYSRFKFWN